MFRLIKSLNNNAALVKNEKNEQAVLMGLGISFQKKKGDRIDNDKIEKIFSLKNNDAKENFLLLLKDIPLDFITVTYELIDTISEQFNYPIHHYLYVTLTDHIYFAYQALQKGEYQESHLPDISKAYKEEYEMASFALEIIRKRLLKSFPDDERARIALHFINAKGEEQKENQDQDNRSNKLLTDVECQLQKHGISRQGSNANYYDRFMIHLTYFLTSIDRKEIVNNSILQLDSQVRKEYPKAYAIGNSIYDLIGQASGHPLNEAERLYIVLHIQRLM
ncbi:PRD domain-containing protein [Streptococcus catagoni]|uniref:PRD domain-containing protein n=1 Tax=Streptococcus catagoni TaxID=2654874 RepID=UPI00140DC0CA|nr:PRD domain-containing protein [Streptococcus catagoni]